MKKKLLAVVLAVTCAIGMSACSSSNNQQTSDTTDVDAQVIDEFNIAFAPYDASETMLAETEPLKGLLQEKLLEKGYDVKDINLYGRCVIRGSRRGIKCRNSRRRLYFRWYICAL